MAELERELRALAVEWPPTPDVAVVVLERIADEPAPAPAPAPRRARLPRVLVARPALGWALAALVAVAGVLAASPDARSAILEFFGLKGARIERRAPQATPAPRPPSNAGASLGLGERVTTAAALRAVEFDAAAPDVLGAPDATYLDELRPPGGSVSFVYQRVPGVRVSRQSGVAVLVTVLQGDASPAIEKAAGPGARVEPVKADGQPGFRITGELHGFGFIDRDGNFDFHEQRLAGTTLLLQRSGDRLVRVEGELSKARAIAIARAAAP